jgi:hypothetical protein
MEHYRYLIVGGGMTADSAVRGIREVDSKGTIGLVSAEPHPPYDRPTVSKSLWKRKPVEQIWRKTAEREVAIHLGHTIRTLDLTAKEAVDERGTRYGFDKLLLATGGTPRRLESDASEIIYYRTLADYERLRALTERDKRFIVIGGGFIGSEVAAALAMNGKQVTMIFPEQAVGARLFPLGLAQFVNGVFQEKDLPFFFSDLFELGYEAVGELDPRLQVVVDWHELNRKGVIYYLRAGRVRGVLLWNVWNQVEAARRLIGEKELIKPDALIGRLTEPVAH